MILNNVEAFSEWDIRDDWAERRKKGISAFVRLKDEAEYVWPALESISWCDEIVIVLQGLQTDGTNHIVGKWIEGRKNARLYFYPFDSLPNGPGHDKQRRGSVHERAYFYNWCLAQTTFSHALKWDGDMVAMDNAADVLRDDVDGMRFHGVEITTPLYSVARNRKTATETRLFMVTPATFYRTGALCEQFTGASSPIDVAAPLFLHFKWAKAVSSAIKAWPEEWESMPHFQNLMDRGSPVERYTGPIPKPLRQ